MTDFVVRQRKVDQFRVGRVFLAGDSAHCHSPLGARGMNTGLQDAWNLAWKLSLANAGLGRVEALLDSYSSEREPVAKSLLEDVGRNTKMATFNDPVRRAFRNLIMGQLTKFERVQLHLLNNATQLDIQYRESPIVSDAGVGMKRRGLRAGDRAPDVRLGPEPNPTLHGLTAGMWSVVLLFVGTNPTDGELGDLTAIATEIGAHYRRTNRAFFVVADSRTPEALAEWTAQVVRDPESRAHKKYGAKTPCVYAVRPDGYIGYRGGPIRSDSLRAWMDSIFVRDSSA